MFVKFLERMSLLIQVSLSFCIIFLTRFSLLVVGLVFAHLSRFCTSVYNIVIRSLVVSYLPVKDGTSKCMS